MLKWTYMIASRHHEQELSAKPRHLWSKANFPAISTLFNQHDWIREFESLPTANECFEHFRSIYNYACNMHIPTTTSTKKDNFTPWASQVVLDAIKEKRKSWWRWIASKSPTALKIYRDVRKRTVAICKAAKEASRMKRILL